MTEPTEAHTAIIIVEVEDSSIMVDFVPPLLSMITGSPEVSFLVGPWLLLLFVVGNTKLIGSVHSSFANETLKGFWLSLTKSEQRVQLES